MKRFFGFVKKEFLHIFRDFRTLIILFGIPASQILIFGFVISTDIENAGIAFLDLSKDEISTGISDRICSSGFFSRTADLAGYEEADRVMKSGRAKAVIIFPAGFGREFLSGRQTTISIIADGSEPNTATLITSYASAIISDFNREYTAPGMTAPLPVQPEVRMFYNPGLKSHYMFVPGVITLILILICALMTSITIAREKEFGTMEVLLVSPLKPSQIIIGKVMPYFFLSFINVIVILLLSWLVFDLPVRGSLALLLAETMLYIMMSLSLGILISTFTANMQQAIFISLIGLMLPTILLSGFIFPIENMPKIYDVLSSVLPPRYFIVIIKNLMIKGKSFSYVWKETLILTLMTIVFLGISIRNFKIRLE
ncbi:MAG TPA: ABC transporter permease [Bacteroidales bacterium]|jgi:ABC-2 type transport system permease protein|nr:ABC transporter permease [Bacteroidales bacterium]HQH24240.1 ABC transporter permease [Bacteroidales bacterium]HQJ82689.1 ABC transporter permease [Bacteroidales bacterium]